MIRSKIDHNFHCKHLFSAKSIDILLYLCYNNPHEFIDPSNYLKVTPLNPNIFREFSIRGIADRDLTDDVMVTIGWAIAIFFQQHDADTLVLGRDVRNSSSRIRDALIQGCQQASLKVIDVGVVPTPILNFATDFYEAGAGVMITASHNPFEYNGLKIRNAERTLYGDEIQAICELAQSYDAPQMSGENDVTVTDIIPSYLEQLKALAHFQTDALGRSLRVIVDGGNGANGLIVAQLLQDLGLDVIKLNCEQDGDFPGRGPDPTKSGALDTLAHLVQERQADLGLAYDGDGDRLALVDDQGNGVLGDQLMMVLARDILQQGSAKIVYELLCTQALADDVVAYGGEPIMTPSGYAFVHEAMRKVTGAIGGELSGHIFFNEAAFQFDDAILATVKLLNVLSRRDQSFSSIVADLPKYNSSPQVRLACPDALKGNVVEYIRDYFSSDYQVDTIDGARVHFEDGWATVRQSNTQPVLSMRFEARTAESLETIQNQVRGLVEAKIKELAG